MKKIILVLALAVGVIFGMAGCGKKQSGKVANSYVAMDINPSVEVITDNSGLVVEVNAINADGKLVIKNIKVEGENLETAAKAILAASIKLGFVTETKNKEVLVSVAADADAEAQKALAAVNRALAQIKKEAKFEIGLIEGKIDNATTELQQLAKDLGVSLGKLKLIATARMYDLELTLADGATKSVEELNAIIKAGKAAWRAEYQRDFTNAEQKALIDLEVKNTALAYLERAEYIADHLEELSVEEQKALLGEQGAALAELYANYEEALDEIDIFDDDFIDVLLEKHPLLADKFAKAEAAFKEAEASYKAKFKEFKETLKTIKDNNDPLLEVVRAAIAEYIAIIQNAQDALALVMQDIQEQLQSYLPAGEGHFVIEFDDDELEIEYAFSYAARIDAVKAEYAPQFTALGTTLEAVENTVWEALSAEQKAKYDEWVAEKLQTKTDLIAEFKLEDDELELEFEVMWQANGTKFKFDVEFDIKFED